MKAVQLNTSDRGAWNDFVAKHPSGHTLQSWEWGDFKSKTGWQPIRLGFYDGARLEAAAQVLVRRPLPFGFGKVAYVPKGPVLDYSNAELLDRVLAALVGLARQYHVMSLKIEPEVAEPSPLGDLLRSQGWRESSPVQMRSTIWVDLRAGEEAILASFKQKTRYNIRLATRKGVTVTEGDGSQLGSWYEMFQATARRDGFSIHPLQYYRLMLEGLGSRGLAKLFLAQHDGDLLAGIIVFCCGRSAQYMYGASSNEKRNLMAPYLVQWEGMRWAMSRGAEQYDLWGIPDQLHEDEDLWGVYRHKRGYNGDIVRYVGAFDHVRSPLQHAGVERIVRPLFKRVARLRVQRSQ